MRITVLSKADSQPCREHKDYSNAVPLFPSHWLFSSQLFSQSGDLLWNRYKSKNCDISASQIQQTTRHRRHKNWSQVLQFTNLRFNLQFNKFLVIPRIVVLTEPGFLWNGRRLCTRCSQWAGRAGCPQLARRSSICICICGCNCHRICALCSCLCICVFCRRHT